MAAAMTARYLFIQRNDVNDVSKRNALWHGGRQRQLDIIMKRERHEAMTMLRNVLSAASLST